MIDHSHTSPNQSSREGADVSMIVLHATAGLYASSLAWLCSSASKVSTHYLIDRDGHTDQLVADDRAAWHAGVSQWFDFDSGEIQRGSIGIELVNKNNGIDPYPSEQMAALLDLCRVLITRYHIVPDMVTRHLDIAIPHGRKSDPAGFPWSPFKAALYPPPITRSYRAITCAPVFQDRRPDAPLALTIAAGVEEPVDDVTNGWIHLYTGAGFSPLSCWEPV